MFLKLNTICKYSKQNVITKLYLKNRNTLSVEMSTVLSKHKGELFGKSKFTLVYLPKGYMVHLTVLWVVVA